MTDIIDEDEAEMDFKQKCGNYYNSHTFITDLITIKKLFTQYGVNSYF